MRDSCASCTTEYADSSAISWERYTGGSVDNFFTSKIAEYFNIIEQFEQDNHINGSTRIIIHGKIYYRSIDS